MSIEEFVNDSQLRGYNCTQIVLLYFAKNYGLAENLALSIAQGFAKGMYMGVNCGVRSGAYMVLGLAYANTDKALFKAKLKEFNIKFREISCYDTCNDILINDCNKTYNDLCGGTVLPICNRLILGTINILNNILGG